LLLLASSSRLFSPGATSVGIQSLLLRWGFFKPGFFLGLEQALFHLQENDKELERHRLSVFVSLGMVSGQVSSGFRGARALSAIKDMLMPACCSSSSPKKEVKELHILQISQ
jgi:hypothetical protein